MYPASFPKVSQSPNHTRTRATGTFSERCPDHGFRFQCRTCKAIQPKAVDENRRDPTIYSECSRLRSESGFPYDMPPSQASMASGCRTSIWRVVVVTTSHSPPSPAPPPRPWMLGRVRLCLLLASQLIALGCLPLSLALTGGLVLLSSDVHLLGDGALTGHLGLGAVNL